MGPAGPAGRTEVSDGACGRPGRRHQDAQARGALGIGEGLQGHAPDRPGSPRRRGRGGRGGTRGRDPQGVLGGQGRPRRRVRLVRRGLGDLPRGPGPLPRAGPDREGHPVRGGEPPPRPGDRGRGRQLGQDRGHEGRQPGPRDRRAQGRPRRGPRHPAPRRHRARERRPRRDGALHRLRGLGRVRRDALGGPRRDRGAHHEPHPGRRRPAAVHPVVPRRQRVPLDRAPAGPLAPARRGHGPRAQAGPERPGGAARPGLAARHGDPRDGEERARSSRRTSRPSAATTSSASSTARSPGRSPRRGATPRPRRCCSRAAARCCPGSGRRSPSASRCPSSRSTS